MLFSRELEGHIVVWGALLVGLIVVMAIIGYEPSRVFNDVVCVLPWQKLRSLAI